MELWSQAASKLTNCVESMKRVSALRFVLAAYDPEHCPVALSLTFVTEADETNEGRREKCRRDFNAERGVAQRTAGKIVEKEPDEK